MHKIFSILSIMLIYTAVLFGQAAIDIPLTISDNATPPNSKILNFGLDLTATNGIDPALGESDLPPFPPTGVFEARFDLEPYAGAPLATYKDYRNIPTFDPPWSGIREHRLTWQLGTGASTLSITYNLPGFIQSMVIQDIITGTLFNSGALSGSGTYTITIALTVAKITITYHDVTPVELTSFTGYQDGQAVQLNWSTATELNNKGFDVERKTQNSDWEKISFVTGKGTTTEVQNYIYKDDFSKNAITGPISYRLKQIDFDGTSTYSSQIQVDVNFAVSEYALMQNYPNPFNPSTSIQYALPSASNVKIVIYNTLGQQVGQLLNQVQQAGYHNITWNASNMTSGLYFYQLEAKSVDGANSFSSVKKMMLIK